MPAQHTIIEARYGTATALRTGEIIKVINSHGSQVLDSWAFSAADAHEYMCMQHTHSVNSSINIEPGWNLVTNRRRPILQLVEDSSPGKHDTVLCACNSAIYAELGVTGDHRSCEDNLHEVLRANGISLTFTPPPLNLFMNTPVVTGGAIDRRAPVSKAGDFVRLKAMMDLLIVFSACPQDITPINGDLCQPQDAAFVVER